MLLLTYNQEIGKNEIKQELEIYKTENIKLKEKILSLELKILEINNNKCSICNYICKSSRHLNSHINNYHSYKKLQKDDNVLEKNNFNEIEKGEVISCVINKNIEVCAVCAVCDI